MRGMAWCRGKNRPSEPGAIMGSFLGGSTSGGYFDNRVKRAAGRLGYGRQWNVPFRSLELIVLV